MTPDDRRPAPMLYTTRALRTASAQQTVTTAGVVDRCVCRNVTFARVREWLDSRRASGAADITLDQACDALVCSDKCGMCRPYLERVERGEGVAFEVE